jgi:hypothetical protein
LIVKAETTRLVRVWVFTVVKLKKLEFRAQVFKFVTFTLTIYRTVFQRRANYDTMQYYLLVILDE